jgi:hypothetical protein
MHCVDALAGWMMGPGGIQGMQERGMYGMRGSTEVCRPSEGRGSETC